MTDEHWVLVVEDEGDVREALAEILEDEGYRVKAVENGAEALAFLRSGAGVCMVLLDLMMPVMDGWAFREEQLRDPAIAGVPVVVVTASQKVNSSLGGVPVLKKPLRVEKILDVVAAHC